MLNKNRLVPKIQVLSNFLISALCCFLRIGTFLDLRLYLLDSRLDAMLALFQGSIARRRGFGKGSGEIEGRNILSSLMFQLLKDWQRDFGYWCPRRSRSNTDLGKVRIQLLDFVLKSGLSNLIPLRSGWRRLDIFSLR